MPHKILLVGPMPKEKKVTGASIAFETLVKELESRNHNISVIDIGSNESEKIGVLTIDRILPSISALLKAFILILQKQSVYLTLSSSRFGFLRNMPLIWWAWLFNKHIILHLHGGGYLEFYKAQSYFIRRIIVSTLTRSNYIIVLGEILKSQFSFAKNLESKLRIVPNSLSKEMNISEVTIKNLPTEKQPLHLLFLSNLIPSKGYLTVLDACIYLIEERNLNIVCNFCGIFLQTTADSSNQKSPDLQKQEFLERIASRDLNSRIVYHGTVGGKVKYEMLRQAHLLLLPTYYPWEGQPISIIEALAFATPVISTHHKGIPEQVIDGYNGYLVPSETPHAIVNAVLQAIKSQETYNLLSQNALTHFKENFTINAYIDKLIPLICLEK
jgi:glycosyltransferase involved in cell wall biosynthesis